MLQIFNALKEVQHIYITHLDAVGLSKALGARHSGAADAVHQAQQPLLQRALRVGGGGQ